MDNPKELSIKYGQYWLCDGKNHIAWINGHYCGVQCECLCAKES